MAAGGGILFLLSALAVAACSHHSDPGDGGGATSMVIGITTEDMGATLGTLHVATTIDGQPATDEIIDVIKNPKWFPKEVKVAPKSGTSGIVEVKIDGYLDTNWTPAQKGGLLLLTRLGKATFVPGQSTLMRITLQQQCLLGLPGGGGPGVGGPVCNPPLTCVSGSCQKEDATLEPYAPNWATDAPDICKPAGGGPPVVQVGTGQTDYLPLTDGQALQAELGPQGGHHIWIAARMHNLKQSGSTTTITATQPGTGRTVPATAFVFTFDKDEGGFCKLYGLRFQLDAGGNDYKPLLGQPLDVTVTIKDASGSVGTNTSHITIAPTVLCPGGQPTCG